MPLAQAGPRLNQLQVIGTHNSYHVAPHPSLDALIRARNTNAANSTAYTHRPIAEQLGRLGIRQLELDLFADPEGGLFAEPKGIERAKQLGMIAPPAPDAARMRAPGIKVMHVPDFDFQTTVPTFRQALEELRTWSDAHPAHVPIFVLLELKGRAVGPQYTQPLPWNEARLDALEQEILDVLPPSRMLRPDDVRGSKSTLREAVVENGWPELARVRGRIIFALDNTDSVREQYLARSTTLENRILFVSVDEMHPAAAWFKINDPVAEFDRIQRLVRAGFLVRTRSDADMIEVLNQDASRREKAFASGAQFISTDFPEPQPSLGAFAVRWPHHIVARPNPISAPQWDSALDLEELGSATLVPFVREELDLLNRRAFGFHTQRRLTEASADYDRLLALDEIQPPTPTQRERILALAPTLRLVENEPFALKAVVAVHHPGKSVIAYHLFWEDDIDFPDDNDPTDHEVVWVRYDEANGKPASLYTYFHGSILQSETRDLQPHFAIEWGKHGSLPFVTGTDAQPHHLNALRENWSRLFEKGTRRPGFPLGRNWPTRFAGDFAAYCRFTRELKIADKLRDSDFVFVTRWANAVINRHALPYNFAAKLEWPAPDDLDR